MAEEQGSALPIATIAGAVVVPLVLAVGLFFGVQTSAGASAGQPINPAPHSAEQPVLGSLDALTNPTDVLQKDLAGIDNLRQQVMVLQTQLASNQAPFTALSASDKTKAKSLLGNLTNDLNKITANSTNNRELAQKSADSFISDKNILRLLLSGPTSTSTNGVPVLKQNDGKPDTFLPIANGSSNTVKTSGCGLVSATMVLDYYKKNLSIGDVQKFYVTNSFYVPGSGSGHDFFPAVGKHYGLKVDDNLSWNQAMSYVGKGVPVILSGRGARPFSFNGGHFVVMTNKTASGQINVNDPAHPNGEYAEDVIRSHWGGYAVAFLPQG